MDMQMWKRGRRLIAGRGRAGRGIAGALLLSLLAVAVAWLVTACQTEPISEVEIPQYNQPGYWPMAIDTTAGRIEIYQPQPESFSNGQLTATAAVALQRPGDGMEFGAAWFTARLMTDRDTRMAQLRDVKVSRVQLPTPGAADGQEFDQVVSDGLNGAQMTFPLDELMPTLDTASIQDAAVPALNNTPPRILFSTIPATLISINGPPKFQELSNHPGVSRVANTPFIILQDDANRQLYLKAGTRWVTATAIAGPWVNATSVPANVAAAGEDLATPETPSATQPLAAGPGVAAPPAPELAPIAANAQIIVATDPTELIVTDGNPQFTPVEGAGGGLMYASNTDSDVFLDQTSGQYYVLLSGRWYAAPSLNGPWQYVAADKLPPAFAQISPDSPRADVLTFVAGTTEAREGVLEASIPQTANISRSAGADLSVAYDGAPQFQNVPESTGVAYAVNTPEQVFLVSGMYYCCHQGVWYQSPAATGPWTVCTAVPGAIYTLPPSCPDYNASYVYVYDVEPDYVTCGYLPGYTGCYAYGPTIVYGTGYWYPGWFGTAYFPPPCTWGFGAIYDPFTCAWGFDVGLYWGGSDWFCHPWHERWWADHPGEHWGWHQWWGPGGYNHAWNTRENLVAARRHGAFGRLNGARLGTRLPGEASRGTGWQNIYARDGNAHRLVAANRAQPARQARPLTAQQRATGPARGNVFAGNDGQVFRRSANGAWQENRTGRAWTPVSRVPLASPTFRAPPQQRLTGSFIRPEGGLEQHFAARSRGEFRTGAVQGFEGGHGMSLGGFRGGGGFPTGGGSGGGGGFHGGGGGRGGGRR